jgi:hypothetical protein
MTLSAFLALRRATLTSSDKSAWLSFATRNYHIGWFSVGAEDENNASVKELLHRKIVQFDGIPMCIRYGFEPADIRRAWSVRMTSSRHCKYYLQDADGDIHCAG